MSLWSAEDDGLGGTGGGGRDGRAAVGLAGRDTNFDEALEGLDGAPPFCSLGLGWNLSGLGCKQKDSHCVHDLLKRY